MADPPPAPPPVTEADLRDLTFALWMTQRENTWLRADRDKARDELAAVRSERAPEQGGE